MKQYKIMVDEELWGFLKQHAEPFEDTPNSVLRRIIFNGTTAKTNISSDFEFPSFPTGIPKALEQTLEVIFLVKKFNYSRSEATNIEMVINAQESERQRLSRQMHDGPAQALSNFILQAEIALRLLSVDVDQARDELNSLKASATRTFQKVRNFIFELRPMMLDDLGLVPTIRRYSETFKEQSGIEMNLVVSGTERRLESYLEVMVFRALQELLGNASRHSHATIVKVYLDVGESLIKVSVDDNGKGFDVDTLNEGGSLGLKLIRDRVEILGGSFDIDSSAGKGTRVAFSIPAES
jgi:two-component system sensor histidine kinase DegS